MDDDVRELSRKCAKALGLAFIDDRTDGGVTVQIPGDYPYNFRYAPSENPGQAFALLCWLAERGTIRELSFRTQNFVFDDVKYVPCRNAPELRLAIMRAVCKVKEGTK